MNQYERRGMVPNGGSFDPGEILRQIKRRVIFSGLRSRQPHQQDVVEVADGNKERARTDYIRTFVVDSDLPHILRWVSDPETQLHLDPSPEVPDWGNPADVQEKLSTLHEYYSDPNIASFVSVNSAGEPLAVSSMRLKDDKYIKNQERNRSPVFERLIVNSDPNLRHQGIGTEHTATVLQYMFDTYRGYTDEQGRERGTSKIFAWIMERGDWQINKHFFRRLGFQVVGHWKEIARKLGVPIKEDADLMMLWPGWFRDAQFSDQRIRRCATIKTQPDEL